MKNKLIVICLLLFIILLFSTCLVAIYSFSTRGGLKFEAGQQLYVPYSVSEIKYTNSEAISLNATYLNILISTDSITYEKGQQLPNTLEEKFKIDISDSEYRSLIELLNNNNFNLKEVKGELCTGDTSNYIVFKNAAKSYKVSFDNTDDCKSDDNGVKMLESDSDSDDFESMLVKRIYELKEDD